MFETAIWKMASILSQPRCVKSWIDITPFIDIAFVQAAACPTFWPHVTCFQEGQTPAELAREAGYEQIAALLENPEGSTAAWGTTRCGTRRPSC